MFPDVRARRDSRPAARRRRASSAASATCPENPYFYDYLTAEELLTYFAGLFGYRAGGAAARASTGCSTRSASAPSGACSCGSSRKGMLQRVGIAQALINDPELVFLDEPMSGLDPLGRRDVRALILRLRDRGCTVFFSSHVLSDAEALCSRVAILAKGRLRRRSGRLTEMLAFQVRGWELVVDRRRTDDGVGALGVAARARRPHRRRPLRSSSCRSTAARPRAGRELAAAGAQLVSLNPIRETLEDFFVQQVAARRRSRDRGPTVCEDGVMSGIASIALNVFRESVRDKVLYNLVALRGAADRRVVSDRPAHGRAGRQDHQGPRAWRRSRSSDCSSPSSSASAWCRRKSSGAASTACWPSRSPLPAGARQVPRARADAGREPGGHGGRALRRAGVHGVEARRGVRPGAGRRRPLDPALLKAIALIFVELALVTAIALFFSTFSTPMLSAAFTFGLFVAGHFSADLRNFEQVVDRRAAAARARRSTGCCRTSRRSTSRSQVVHGAAGAARLPGADARGYGAALHRASCCVAGDRDLLAAGLQVMTPARVSRRVVARRVARAGVLLGAAVGCRLRASARIRRRRRRGSLYVHVGRCRCAGCRSATDAARPTCTGFAPFSITADRAHRHAAAGRPSAAGRRHRATTAVPAARSDDVARPALQHRLPVRRDFPRRAVSGRRRAGRIWRSRCSKRDCAAAARQVGIHAGHRLRALLVGRTTTQAAAEWFSRAAEMPGRAVVAAVAGGHHAGAGRDRQRRACGRRSAQSADDDWLRKEARAAAAAARRARSRSTRCRRIVERLARETGRRHATWDVAGARRRAAAAFRSIRRASPYELDPRRQRRRRRRVAPATRFPTSRSDGRAVA